MYPLAVPTILKYRAFLVAIISIWDWDGGTVPNIQHVGPFVGDAVKMGLRSFGEYQYSKILHLLVTFCNKMLRDRQ